MQETFCTLIKIWLKFDPKGPIYNYTALVQTRIVVNTFALLAIQSCDIYIFLRQTWPSLYSTKTIEIWQDGLRPHVCTTCSLLPYCYWSQNLAMISIICMTWNRTQVTIKPLIEDCTSVNNKIVDHSDVVSVLLQLHLRCQLNTWLQWIGQRRQQDEARNI